MDPTALVVLLLAFLQVEGGPFGAPLEACSTMVPGHGVPPQTSKSPFTTILTPDGRSVRLTLIVDSQGFSYFKGYLTMAFDASKPNSTEPIGYFAESNARVEVTPGNYLSCPGANAQPNNAATHMNSDDKQIVNLLWNPVSEFVGNVTFKTTFVYNKAEFWVKTSSETIYIAGEPTTATATPIPTTTTPATTRKPDGGGANTAIPSFGLLAILFGTSCLLQF